MVIVEAFLTDHRSAVLPFSMCVSCTAFSKRKLNVSLWILIKCTDLWHLDISAHFLLRAAGCGVLRLFKGWSISAEESQELDIGLGFFGGAVHREMQHFWKRPDQQGDKENIPLAISPS